MNARRLLTGGALAAALAVLAGGCLLDSEKAPIINERGGTININVSGGLTPEYSWDGGGMMYLAVSRVGDSPQVVWQVWGTGVFPGKPAEGKIDGERVDSPVRHGIVPTGTSESVRIESRLTPGVTYRVAVKKDDSVGGASGSAAFTPQ